MAVELGARPLGDNTPLTLQLAPAPLAVSLVGQGQQRGVIDALVTSVAGVKTELPGGVTRYPVLP